MYEYSLWGRLKMYSNIVRELFVMAIMGNENNPLTIQEES